jgi:hypothetical protein
MCSHLRRKQVYLRLPHVSGFKDENMQQIQSAAAILRVRRDARRCRSDSLRRRRDSKEKARQMAGCLSAAQTRIGIST